MKKSVLSIILVALVVVVAFSGCKEKEKPTPKSSECEILMFADGTKGWTINNNLLTITTSYTKIQSQHLHNMAPTITVSPGATVNPASGVAQDFSEGNVVVYVVTAEDGVTTRTYEAQASVN